MKNFLQLVAVCFAFSVFTFNTSKAQVTQIAPNFTLTDLDGNVHHLYDYLDQGKPVFLDFFAVWCGPCWNNGNPDIMPLFNAYGPNGDNSIVFLALEADDGTDDNLVNTARPSLGNWFAAMPDVPIINQTGDTPNDYGITGYPSYFLITPNREITEYFPSPSGATLVNDATNWVAGTTADNVSMVSYDGNRRFCNNYSPVATFQNYGTNALTSATFEVVNNGNVVETFNWTGNLSQYNTETITFGDVVEPMNANVEVRVASVNGNTDTEPSYDAVSAVLQARKATTQYINVRVTTDDYAYETYWEMVDDMGTVVASGGNNLVMPGAQQGGGVLGGNPNAYANNTTYNVEVPLPATGCYNFKIYDDYGDGICCGYGSGSFLITDSNGGVLSNGGAFGAQADDPFEVTALVGVEEIVDETSFSIMPNPAKNQFMVEFDLVKNTDMTIGVYNMMGQKVQEVANTSYGLGYNNVTINAADLASGVYMVTLHTAEGNTTQRVTIAK